MNKLEAGAAVDLSEEESIGFAAEWAFSRTSGFILSVRYSHFFYSLATSSQMLCMTQLADASQNPKAAATVVVRLVLTAPSTWRQL
jgi:hypothetical protein